MEPQDRDLCQKHACLPLLRKALKEADVPIKPMQSSFLAVWMDSKPERLRIAEYSPGKAKWNLFDKTFSSRYFFAAAFFNNELIVAGGMTEHSMMNTTVESINLDTMASSNLPSMALKRRCFGIAVLDGLLYAAGGSSNIALEVTNRVERYDPKDCKWSEVAPMSVARYAFGFAALNGRLFAVGGCGHQGKCHDSTEYYDPQTEKWTMLANLRIQRGSSILASGNGYLYAVGEQMRLFDDDLLNIERYDPQADKWTEICSLNNIYNACVFIDGRLLLLKSKSGATLLQEYNPVTKKLTQLAASLELNVNHHLCTVLK